MATFTINMSDEMRKKLNIVAKKNGHSASGFVKFLLEREFVESDEKANEMMKKLKNIEILSQFIARFSIENRMLSRHIAKQFVSENPDGFAEKIHSDAMANSEEFFEFALPKS